MAKKKFGVIKLQHHLPAVGATKGATHRSGWPYCFQLLSRLHSARGILFDDFVDRTFGLPNGAFDRWTAPWIGFFHRPPGIPDHCTLAMRPEEMFRTRAFQISRRKLVGAIAMSAYHLKWLKRRFRVPTLMVKFPTAAGVPFTWDKWRKNANKTLVQVGSYLRNLRAIYQVPTDGRVKKVHVLQDVPWVHATMAMLDANGCYRERPRYGHVQVISGLSNPAFDQLLTSNVVFLELFGASANNAVVECIARNTPLNVNRLPAVEDYLGKDYPLFYTHLSEVPVLLRNERLRAGYEHLRAMDKRDLTANTFVRRIYKFVNDIVLSSNFTG